MKDILFKALMVIMYIASVFAVMMDVFVWRGQ